MLRRYLLGIALVCSTQSAWSQGPVPPSEGSKPANVAPTADPQKQGGSATVTPSKKGIDFTSRRVQALADMLKSPFCPGKTVNTCTSYQAFELRRELREMIESGMTDTQIVALLEARHGGEISNPKQPWYTFFVPFLPFIVLAGLIFWVVQRWRKPAGQASDAPVAASSEHLSRLREQVRLDSD